MKRKLQNVPLNSHLEAEQRKVNYLFKLLHNAHNCARNSRLDTLQYRVRYCYKNH